MVTTLSFFGLGKLGLPLAALFAASGLRTVAIDCDAARVARLKAGEFPDGEPGFAEVIASALPAITFTSDPVAAADTDASIILVPTPSNTNAPAFSSSHVLAACADLCAALRRRAARREHLVIISSTLFPGAGVTIRAALEADLGAGASGDIALAYVPELVALGDVIAGFRNPPVLMVGADTEAAGTKASALYRRIVAADTPVRALAIADAEFAKIALNFFLAMKISFANQLGQLGHAMGGRDLDAIAGVLCLDPRIGRGLLRAGAPYGGPCLPRDVDAFAHLARLAGLDAPLAGATHAVNDAQADLIAANVL